MENGKNANINAKKCQYLDYANEKKKEKKKRIDWRPKSVKKRRLCTSAFFLGVSHRFQLAKFSGREMKLHESIREINK